MNINRICEDILDDINQIQPEISEAEDKWVPRTGFDYSVFTYVPAGESAVLKIFGDVLEVYADEWTIHRLTSQEECNRIGSMFSSGSGMSSEYSDQIRMSSGPGFYCTFIQFSAQKRGAFRIFANMMIASSMVFRQFRVNDDGTCEAIDAETRVDSIFRRKSSRINKKLIAEEIAAAVLQVPAIDEDEIEVDYAERLVGKMIEKMSSPNGYVMNYPF